PRHRRRARADRGREPVWVAGARGAQWLRRERAAHVAAVHGPGVLRGQAGAAGPRVPAAHRVASPPPAGGVREVLVHATRGALAAALVMSVAAIAGCGPGAMLKDPRHRAELARALAADTTSADTLFDALVADD